MNFENHIILHFNPKEVQCSLRSISINSKLVSINFVDSLRLKIILTKVSNSCDNFRFSLIKFLGCDLAYDDHIILCEILSCILACDNLAHVDLVMLYESNMNFLDGIRNNRFINHSNVNSIVQITMAYLKSLTNLNTSTSSTSIVGNCEFL